jgi:carbon storage regulator
MLILRRKAGETIRIGDEIAIEVLEVSASQVKLGIRAPREVPVLREEIWRTAQENRAAARMVNFGALERLRAGAGISTENPPEPCASATQIE